MRTSLLYFRKDSRHLWWAILAATAMYGVLVWTDCWRRDSQPDPVTGWGNLVVPFLWALLMALAVLEDPLSGRRQFWLTTPATSREIFGAKALFALCWIHAPYLVGCIIVLAARGFSPWAHPGALLEQQAAVLLMVTLPAMALASVVGNAAHFTIIALVVVAVEGFTGPLMMRAIPFFIRWYAEQAMFIMCALGLTAILVLGLTYGARRIPAARLAGSLALLLTGGVLHTWTFETNLRTLTWLRGSEIHIDSFALKPEAPVISNEMLMKRRGGVGSGYWIPYQIACSSREEHLLYAPLQVTLTNRRGETLTSSAPEQNWSGRRPSLLAMMVSSPEAGKGWLQLVPDGNGEEKIGSGPLKLSGEVVALDYKKGRATPMDPFTRTDVAGVGICVAELREATLRGDAVSVLCESAGRGVEYVQGRFWRQDDPWELRFRLDQAWNNMSWPRLSWLSPVKRKQSLLPVVQVMGGYQSVWEVPREKLQGLKLELAPIRQRVSQVVRFKLEGVELKKFVMRSAQ
ncbi:MAG: hypothetical protein HY821_12600 [Acidobacteria bacterium]|nr:hypothetical protein [Acidobacteriota bacterium]